mgnify:CR=1 FL=1
MQTERRATTGSICLLRCAAWRLLQKAMHGPEAIPARQALRIATIEGAQALGLEKEIGTLEIGKRADVVVVNLTVFILLRVQAILSRLWCIRHKRLTFKA